MNTGKLISAFIRCGSDKSKEHHYELAYSQILPDKVDALLEIGIANYSANQSSVHAWHELYPDAKIYAIDIVPDKMINNEFTKSFVVDQSSRKQLTKFRDTVGEKFDVIIDDGSHMFEHATLTYEILKDLLTDDGIYVVEDIQKVRFYTYQSISEWKEYLDFEDIKYEVFDCQPHKQQAPLVISICK